MGFVKRIVLKNWMLMESVDLELGPGPYFIRGINNDETSQASNGAGKSLLCESILWILFQHTRKNCSVKDVIGEHGDEAYGRLELFHRGKDLVIERRRTKSKSYVKILDGGADLSTHKDPEAKIAQLLGVSKNTLLVAGYEGLLGEDPLVSYTDTALKNEVMRILDLERFKMYDKELGKLRASLVSKLEEAKRGAEKSLAVLVEVENDLARLMEKLGNFDDLRRNKIAEYKNKILELELQIKAESEQLQDLDEMKQKLRSMDNVKQRVDVLSQEVNRLSREIRKIQRINDDKKRKLASLETKEEEYKARLSNLTSNLTGECSYCGSDLSKSSSIGDKIAENEAALKQVLADAIELRVEVGDGRRKIETKQEIEVEKREKLKEFDDLLADRNRLIYEIKSVQTAKKLIAGYEEQKQSYQRELEQVESYSKDSLIDRISTLEERLETREAMYDEDSSRVESIEANIEAISSFRKAISAYRDAVFNSFALSLQDVVNEHFDLFASGDFHCDLIESKSGLSFTFTSVSKDGKYLSWHEFSTGERVRIQKAVVMALMTLLDLPFLVDDESFHGVDDTRPILQSMLDACEGRTLLYISHRVTSKEFFDRCNKILVEKTDGVISATVEERV